MNAGLLGAPAGFADVSQLSGIHLNLYNGVGSSSGVSQRFGNIVIQQGTDVLYEDSAVFGPKWTAAVDGLYSISFTNEHAGGAWSAALSLNFDTPNIIPNSLPRDVVQAAMSNSAGFAGCIAIVRPLRAGDTIRTHTNGAGGPATANYFQFQMWRIA